MRVTPLLASVFLLAATQVADPGPPGPEPDQVARGRQVFELVCSGCHTLDPPPDSAPPMRHVSRHLRQDLTTFDAFAEHVRTYVPTPSAEASRLPPMAIERFGVMAPLPLAEDVLTAAAAYIWTLADSAGPMGNGMGMQHRHGRGMAGDTMPGG